MLSYKDFTKHFGKSLFDRDFQIFLKATFYDLTEYDILESNYITSENCGVELGFTNKDAAYDDDDNIVFEKGNPIFSHFITYSKSSKLIGDLPFDVTFADTRPDIINKAGDPVQTKGGYSDFLNKNFLVDNYKQGDIIITFDFDAETQLLNFIQVRDNNLLEHIKI
jgi:hypothetical protein